MRKQFIITVSAPCECTDEQFEEWVKFCSGYQASIDIENPLSEHDMEVTGIEEY